MTDRELIEMAAKAAGITGMWDSYAGVFVPTHGQLTWTPLTDDGDALRLAVKLRIDIDNMTDACYCEGPCGQEAFVEIENDDHYAATRRAIVRAAAAEIGKAMS